MDITEALAGELRAQRSRSRLTVDRVAELTGLSKSSVLRYLDGSRDIPLTALFSLAEAMDAAPSELLAEAERRMGRAGEPTKSELQDAADEVINSPGRLNPSPTSRKNRRR